MFPRSIFVSLSSRGFRLMQAETTHTNSYSSTASTQVVVGDDGRTLVCWHPEPEIPYELTSPLPKEEEIEQSVISALNVNDKRNVSRLEAMKEEFARQELMKLTHTTKHRWFPRPKKRFAKKTPMDRPYL
ncbi:39S ribosomal protein L42, mitochondrial [Frankliniella fusca]|uniref:Large ribosomal subunit protein mL42 n=1 Tax=Frankliniella fusca TaxID=407009 RepID=A0AAE1LGP8_9NEOP|nr:39S ribosomal protein L42, mitochondrial [Frankliniella fusca]